ncbi:MAG: hypothetical protein WCK47_07750 [bacterium]
MERSACNDPIITTLPGDRLAGDDARTGEGVVAVTYRAHGCGRCQADGLMARTA